MAWHLMMGEKEHGPYELDQLREMYLQGMLNKFSKLKTTGGEFITAGDIEELFPKQETSAEPKENEPEFEVYSSGQKEPGAFDEYLTKRNIIAAVFISAWLIYGLVLMNHYSEESDKIEQRLEAQRQQQQMIDQMQYQPNISTEQIQQALQQQAQYNY